jgi:hypothetical protein
VQRKPLPQGRFLLIILPKARRCFEESRDLLLLSWALLKRRANHRRVCRDAKVDHEEPANEAELTLDCCHDASFDKKHFQKLQFVNLTKSCLKINERNLANCKGPRQIASLLQN